MKIRYKKDSGLVPGNIIEYYESGCEPFSGRRRKTERKKL